MRLMADADLMVVDITNRCMYKCSNCTRLVAHQTHTLEMSPEYFREVLRTLKEWWRPGFAVGVIGGEPTLHSQFEAICDVFMEEWNPGVVCTHGREPIGDFDAFAKERLFDRGLPARGLWTSFGPRFRVHQEKIMDTFSLWNPNDHTQGGIHQAMLVDARTMCERLDIPWSKFPEYRSKCWVANTWSPGITAKGVAFCEVAAQLDLLYNDGKRLWPLESDWWKRTPDQYGEQLDICEMCSLCLPGPGQVDALDKDIICPTHRQRLAIAKSPAIPKGNFTLISELPVIDQREITTKDNYVGESGIRVSADNKSVRPRKLSAVVVSVGCDDQLASTGNKNSSHFDQFVVVGPLNSRVGAFLNPPYTLKLCDAPAEDAFNKGAYLNAGLDALDNPDWVVFLDADIVLPDNFREFFFSHTWNPGCLYYTHRSDTGSPHGIDHQPNGYFQMWSPLAGSLLPLVCEGKKLPVMSEKFCSAGGIDSWFAQQYPPDKRIYVPELAVTHLDHGEFAKRWNGDRLDPCWKQIGIINFRAEYRPLGASLPFDARDGVCQIRLTDTKFALQHETEMVKGILKIENILEFTPDGILFLGKNIGMCHIHVAARF